MSNRFGISHFDDLENASVVLTYTILYGVNGVDAVVNCIHTTALLQSAYTRTLALLVRRICWRLSGTHSELEREFRERITQKVIGTYYKLWARFLGSDAGAFPTSTLIECSAPQAICAFIGDLLYAEMISFEVFNGCIMHLIHQITAREHITCLEALFKHGCAQQQDEVSSGYIIHCMNIVRGRCAQYLGPCTAAEMGLRAVMFDLEVLSRAPRASWRVFFDKTLDLNTALAASARLNCANNGYSPLSQYTETSSPLADWCGVSPASSTSSMGCVEKLPGFLVPIRMPALQHPRPVRVYIPLLK